MEADGYGGVDEDDYLCIGDHICLYSEQASGYLFSEQSNSEENGLYMFHQKSMDHPNAITNPHGTCFRILVQNRYKLHKRYRQLLQRSSQSSNEAIVHQTVLEQAKAAADGEVMDNNGEQKRLHGKPVKYGDIIQLLHLFSDKCIHVNQKKTSAKDHGQFTAHLLSYDSKYAQFTNLPKYKINAEGETVRAGDQVVFESVQCPGRFFHASPPFTHYNKQTRHELNLGRLASEFTIIKRFQLRNYGGITHNLWGGAVVYMHHKDIEAYLACDGVFGEDPFEDVHLKVRHGNIMQPTTLFPPTSFQCFWQLEKEASPLDGEPLSWDDNIRFEHLASRNYLCMSQDGMVSMTTDGARPDTLFRLHAMHKSRLGYFIREGAFARIEHVLSGRWLHGCKDLYVEVGENTPMAECISNSYVYEKLMDKKKPEEWLTQQVHFVDRNLVRNMPRMQQWLVSFLNKLQFFVADQEATNKLILSAVKLTKCLMLFGYFSVDTMHAILSCVLHLLDGSHDMPFNKRPKQSASATLCHREFRSPIHLANSLFPLSTIRCLLQKIRH